MVADSSQLTQLVGCTCREHQQVAQGALSCLMDGKISPVLDMSLSSNTTSSGKQFSVSHFETTCTAEGNAWGDVGTSHCGTEFSPGHGFPGDLVSLCLRLCFTPAWEFSLSSNFN